MQCLGLARGREGRLRSDTPRRSLGARRGLAGPTLRWIGWGHGVAAVLRYRSGCRGLLRRMRRILSSRKGREEAGFLLRRLLVGGDHGLSRGRRRAVGVGQGWGRVGVLRVSRLL